MFERVDIRMLRSCLVDHEGRAEGQRYKVAPAAAHEAVAYAWAEFVDPRDADRAMQAFLAEQNEQMAALPKPRWPGDQSRSPWRSTT